VQVDVHKARNDPVWTAGAAALDRRDPVAVHFHIPVVEYAGGGDHPANYPHAAPRRRRIVR
jgi:hypothetical protein